MNELVKTIEENAGIKLTKESCQKIFQLVDFTTLNTTDDDNHVISLINRANQFNANYGTNVAAICVFPNFISLAKKHLKVPEVKIAAVSASFPTSQTFSEVKYLETKQAIEAGADEIDVVLPVGKLLAGKEKEIEEEIGQLKKICGNKHLKVILETSLLPDLQTVKHASDLCLAAGADFIKTSTGKNGSKASLDAFITMCQCVKGFYARTGEKRGIKPAGGISTAHEALKYYLAVEYILGKDWLNSKYFRIGASSLVDDLEGLIRS